MAVPITTAAAATPIASAVAADGFGWWRRTRRLTSGCSRRKRRTVRRSRCGSVGSRRDHRHAAAVAAPPATRPTPMTTPVTITSSSPPPVDSPNCGRAPFARRDGATRPVLTAATNSTPMPSTAPPITSLGWCTPSYTLDNATNATTTVAGLAATRATPFDPVIDAAISTSPAVQHHAGSDMARRKARRRRHRAERRDVGTVSPDDRRHGEERRHLHRQPDRQHARVRAVPGEPQHGRSAERDADHRPGVSERRPDGRQRVEHTDAVSSDPVRPLELEPSDRRVEHERARRGRPRTAWRRRRRRSPTARSSPRAWRGRR